MMRIHNISAVACCVFCVLITTNTRAQDAPPPKEGERNYSSYPEKTFPNRVYFGDTHLHTSYSTDAGMVGNTLGPEEAYRFARGEEVIQSHGLRAKLQRPLDFLVIAPRRTRIPNLLIRSQVVNDSDLSERPADFVEEE